MPFTKYDLEAITGDSEKLSKFMETYGLRHCRPEPCPKCGGRISQKTTMHRGVMMYRCGTDGCQRRISAESGGLGLGSGLGLGTIFGLC